MKRNLQLLSILMLFGTYTIGQSLEVVNPPEIVHGTTEETDIEAAFDIINTSNISLDVMVTRSIISEIEG